MRAELDRWPDDHCFKIQGLAKAANVMTYRYVYKWKFLKGETGNQVRAVDRGWVSEASSAGQLSTRELFRALLDGLTGDSTPARGRATRAGYSLASILRKPS